MRIPSLGRAPLSRDNAVPENIPLNALYGTARGGTRRSRRTWGRLGVRLSGTEARAGSTRGARATATIVAAARVVFVSNYNVSSCCRSPGFALRASSAPSRGLHEGYLGKTCVVVTDKNSVLKCWLPGSPLPFTLAIRKGGGCRRRVPRRIYRARAPCSRAGWWRAATRRLPYRWSASQLGARFGTAP